MKEDKINGNHFSEKELEKYQEYMRSYHKNSRNPMKIILSFYKGKAFEMIKAGLYMIIQRSPVWVIPIITANIIDLVTNPTDGFRRAMIINLLIAFVFLLQNIATSYLAAKQYSKANRNIEGALRNAIITKLQQLSILFHKEMQSGRLQSKIMRDVENIYELLNQIFRTLLFFVLDFTITVIITLNRSPIVFGFFMIIIPFTVIILYSFRKPISSKNKNFRQEVEKTQGAVSEMLDMVTLTRAHGLQENEIARMNHHLNGIVNKGYQLDLINSLFGAVSWVFFQMFQVICLAFTGHLAHKGKISIGEVILFQTYFTQLVGQISALLNIYPQISKGMESVKSIGDIMADDEVEPNNAIIPLEELQGKVEFVNVDYQYPDSQVKVLKDFKLKVAPGESIAVVGESGAGKSTILNLLIGFQQPIEGKILIDDINMTNLDMTEFRRQIAVVPQNTMLFSGTLRDNITYGLESVKDSEITLALQKVGLEKLAEQSRKGLDMDIGEGGDKLSGGQKQRISIARALIRKPKLILFDEATSALDAASEKQVQNAIEQMMQQSTIFIVAHRLSTVKKADHIIFMKGGEIKESGTYFELLERKGEFYNLYKLQNEV